MATASTDRRRARKPRTARKPRSIIKNLDACLQCGYCKDVCPVYKEAPWESASPRGKVYQLKQLYRKSLSDYFLRAFGREVELNQEFVDRLFWCTSCGMCEVDCHVNIPFPELWEEVKAWAVESGIGPLDPHKLFLERVREQGNPYGDPREKRGDWAKGLQLSKDPEVIFFVGCTESYRMTEIALATAKVLAHAGVKFDILGGDEFCCTSPLLRTGQRGETEGAARRTRAQMERSGAKVMVTACAGCYVTTKRDHVKEIGPNPFKLMHISEFVEQLIKEGRLKLTGRVDRVVTYHDPCHLGRHGKVYDAPRNVIRAIPGIKLVEMPHSRERSWCCGAGAGFKAAFKESAESIAADRVREAMGTGAEEIITACPFCTLNLNAGAKKAGLKIKTRDLLQLVLESIEASVRDDGAAGKGDTAQPARAG